MRIKMNKGKVIGIRNGNTLVRYDENSDPFVVSEERGKLLLESDSATKVDDSVDYESMKVSQLRTLAKECGLSTSGTKVELIERITGGESDEV